jgi:hypothetical protein
MMYIEVEAPSREEHTPALYIGPFADEAAARDAIDQAANVAFEPVRAVTGNGITLMARSITNKRTRHIPTVPALPANREEFSLMVFQYT